MAITIALLMVSALVIPDTFVLLRRKLAERREQEKLPRLFGPEEDT